MRTSRFHHLTGDPIEAFLEFGYPELRTLCLVFILLSTAFLLASIFALKATSRENRILCLGSIASWGLFSFAVAMGGNGLYHLYGIAETLIINRATDGFEPQKYSYYVLSTYSSLDLAGYALVAGIAAFIGTLALQGFLPQKQQLTSEK